MHVRTGTNLLDQGVAVNDVQVDLRATIVKPLHANWLISTITTLSDKKDTIQARRKQIKSGEAISSIFNEFTAHQL